METNINDFIKNQNRKMIFESNKTIVTELFDALSRSEKVQDMELKEKDWDTWNDVERKYTGGVAAIFNKIKGVHFKIDYNYGMMTSVGEYDSKDSGAESILKLDYDSGYTTTIDHSWTQRVIQNRKSGLRLIIESGHDRYSFMLTGASKTELNNIADVVTKLASLKIKDLSKLSGRDNKEKMDKYVKIITNKYYYGR